MALAQIGEIRRHNLPRLKRASWGNFCLRELKSSTSRQSVV